MKKSDIAYFNRVGTYSVTIKKLNGDLYQFSWESPPPEFLHTLSVPIQPNFIQIKKAENEWDVYPISQILFASVKFEEKKDA